MAYDPKKAAAQLQYVEEQIASLTHDQGRTTFDIAQACQAVELMSFETVDKRGSRMLSVQDETTNTTSELMVRITGVLVSSDLAPRRREIAPRERLYVRQHIRLSGFGTSSFTNVIRQLGVFVQEFRPFFEPGTLKSWSPTRSDEGHFVLDANCRYYTSAVHAFGCEDKPFDKTVDPHGILERGKDGNFIHTSDNEVEFYRQDLSDGSIADFNPRGFQEGDIVAAHVVFLMVKTSSGMHESRRLPNPARFQLLLILRGLTLLAKNEHKPMLLKNVDDVARPKRKKLYDSHADNMRDVNMEAAREAGVTETMKHLKVR